MTPAYPFLRPLRSKHADSLHGSSATYRGRTHQPAGRRTEEKKKMINLTKPILQIKYGAIRGTILEQKIANPEMRIANIRKKRSL